MIHYDMLTKIIFSLCGAPQVGRSLNAPSKYARPWATSQVWQKEVCGQRLGDRDMHARPDTLTRASRRPTARAYLRSVEGELQLWQSRWEPSQLCLEHRWLSDNASFAGLCSPVLRERRLL